MLMTAKQQDALIRHLAAASVYFCCLIAFYIDIGQDMGAKYFMPILVPVILGLVLMEWATKVRIFSMAALPNLFTGLAWAMTFPLLYSWTFTTGWYPSKICFDFVVGTAGFILLMCLESVLVRLGHVKITSFLMALLNFACLAIPFVQWVYYCLFWHCLSPASLMALYLTNYRESIDFIQSNLGLLPTAAIVAGFALFIYACYRQHLRFARFTEAEDNEASQFGVLALLVALTLWAQSFYLPQTSWAELWNDVTTYVSQTQEYSSGHDERYDSLMIDASESLAAKAPGTVILIIGESASRNYMKAYTPDFPFENTPWLSEKLASGEPGFLKFANAYASWSQTVPVLQRALTEQSQYNGKEFFESASILDVAKKAGYETWWFSNQGRYGQYDSAITLVAKTADHASWTDDSYNFTDKYDEALLPYLTQIDPSKNNFIVLHIMGSHIYYNNRYPAAFDKFKTAEGETSMLSAPSYANSILYTDYVVSQVFDYAQKHLNLQAMVYFSDHGENLEISHNPDVFTFDMVRIPLWMYLSPAYHEAMPGHTQALYDHRNRYFTNDMLYDTICGLLNAPSSRYSPEQDFASFTYSFSRNDLTTMLGQHKLTEDADGGPEEVTE
ncbi:phosphoethanolamine transferase [Selenomonas ruminantium]|uniref:Heptose-I-phosphate ethanolaminephosphotransferase n=1 Tax=Selenomonas ruminantium TaxID=971 RepID=A0A1H0UGS0_SELRU|nr:phosphoethanolamine transferase [Selenomonas ruminantium]SDP65492.1 heptose-I-phosphate ethanolaminephosphotransferase [Selenomonas ruminantium]